MIRTPLLLLVAAAVLIGGWFVYEIIDTNAPDAVSTEAALEQLQTDSAATEEIETTSDTTDSTTQDTSSTDASTESSDPVEEIAGVEATWTVDDDFGEFGFDNASGSFAGFRVEKSFFSGQDATAVGRTGGVTGELVIGAGELASAQIVVDMTQMVSDDSAREGAINDAIEVSEHPTGTFTVTEAVTLDTDALAGGATVAVDVPGELAIAGTTNDVVIPLEATIVDSGVGLVVGSTNLVWADYGVETPQSSVADVADDGILEFQLIVRTS